MIIKDGNIVLLNSVKKGDIRIQEGKIVEIADCLTANENEEIVCATDKFVTAGFIDIHTHGGFGADFMDCNKVAFEKALKFHLTNGTTGVVPTSCTAPKEI